MTTASSSSNPTIYVIHRLKSKLPNQDFTAKDVWDELQRIYGPVVIQKEPEGSLMPEDASSQLESKENEKANQYSKTKAECVQELYDYTISGKWISVDGVLKASGLKVTDKISSNGNTALHVAVSTTKLMLVPPFIRKRIITHDAFKIFVSSMCKHIRSSRPHHHFYINPIFEATKQNAFEVVKTILDCFPTAIGSVNKDGHNIIAYAVMNRSEKVYDLLLEISATYGGSGVFGKKVITTFHKNLYDEESSTKDASVIGKRS